MKKQMLQIGLAVSLPSTCLAQNIFPFDGNVGIGTASPSAKVTIQAPEGPIMKLIQSNDFGHDGNRLEIVSYPNPNFYGADFAFQTHMWTGSGYEKQPGLLLSANGHVGIGLGKATPPQQLTLTGGIGFANNNAADKKLYSPEDGVLEWMTHDWAAQKGFAVSHQGEKRVFLSVSGNSFLNGGNVGIGTTAPQGTLDVNGNTYTKSLHLTAGPDSGSYIISNERLHLQTSDGNFLHLNPFGGAVHVNAISGGALHVNGKVVTGVLELTSDRNQKQDIEAISAKDILAKVAVLPIQAWAYTNSSHVRHIGPMAQDFKLAFGLGESDQHIGAGDGIGVALAAIQGLHEVVLQQRAEIEVLTGELAKANKSLIKVNRGLLERLSRLEQGFFESENQQVGLRLAAGR